MHSAMGGLVRDPDVSIPDSCSAFCHKHVFRIYIAVYCDSFKEAAISELVVVPAETMVLKHHCEGRTHAVGLAEEGIVGGDSVGTQKYYCEAESPMSVVKFWISFINIEKAVRSCSYKMVHVPPIASDPVGRDMLNPSASGKIVLFELMSLKKAIASE